MITITYPRLTISVDNWQNQLEELVTRHQLIEDPTIETPILTDSRSKVMGEAAINEYMDSLMEFKKAWTCGR